MALLKVLHHPDMRLRTVAAAVESFNAALAQLADDMLETMYHEEGIGLAATQVNVHKRVLVMDVSETRDQPWVCVNPQLSVNPDATIEPYNEGCLSVPEYMELIRRPNKVTIHYQDVKGQAHSHDASGLLAICVQHESDHLEGKLFIDYLSSFKRNRITKKLKKLDK